jgi:hypothetical protein
MFERVGRLAEKTATEVSRRAFLGGLGESALGLAAGIAGALAFPAQARAADKKYYCRYTCPNGTICMKFVRACSSCATHLNCNGMSCVYSGCFLWGGGPG